MSDYFAFIVTKSWWTIQKSKFNIFINSSDLGWGKKFFYFCRFWSIFSNLDPEPLIRCVFFAEHFRLERWEQNMLFSS